jgi:hypothetical protein
MLIRRFVQQTHHFVVFRTRAREFHRPREILHVGRVILKGLANFLAFQRRHLRMHRDVPGFDPCELKASFLFPLLVSIERRFETLGLFVEEFLVLFVGLTLRTVAMRDGVGCFWRRHPLDVVIRFAILERQESDARTFLAIVEQIFLTK